MDIVDEEFTAEEMKQLYNQSVSSTTTTGSSISQEHSGNGTNSGEDIISKTGQNIMENGNGKTANQQTMVCKPLKSAIAKENYTTLAHTITMVTNVSCEDVLMKQFDDKKFTNNSVVAKSAPK